MDMQTHIPHILVVDDDVAIATLVADTLHEAGMDAVTCHDAKEALGLFARESFDLALLDIMMPGMDGLELCSRIRRTSDVPVIFLTARDAESDLVVGFELGAADYIIKPFRPRELVARVRARLQPTKEAPAGGDVLSTRDFTIDRRAHTAQLHGMTLDLTPKEFGILFLLAQNVGSPVSAKDLYEHVWETPYDASAANTIMVHIRHLRQKCEACDTSQHLIDTVWGVGYRLCEGGLS